MAAQNDTTQCCFSVPTDFGVPLKFHSERISISKVYNLSNASTNDTGGSTAGSTVTVNQIGVGGDVTSDMNIDDDMIDDTIDDNPKPSDIYDDSSVDDWIPPPLLSGQYADVSAAASPPFASFPSKKKAPNFIPSTYEIYLSEVVRPQLLSLHHYADSEDDIEMDKVVKRRKIDELEESEHFRRRGEKLLDKARGCLGSKTARTIRELKEEAKAFSEVVDDQVKCFRSLPLSLFEGRAKEEVGDVSVLDLLRVVVEGVGSREVVVVAAARVEEIGVWKGEEGDEAGARLAKAMAACLKGAGLNRAEFCAILSEIKVEGLKRWIAKSYYVS
ncbi:hypothetical protein TrST_g6743 [Triparma strigata]|uniref:Uncharacterized protein n=1 Tax=Triparma strigata TaxID=1606541 RepID=A0A9W7EZF5_9STRA|nr:hypothetical protein TrST_g6743 [Triparma strigata]